MRNPVTQKGTDLKSEPIFGDQARPFFSQLVMLALALGLVILVLVLGVIARDQAHRFLYGEPDHSAVAPDSYQWTPERGLQKLH